MKTEAEILSQIVRCAAPAVNAVEDSKAMRISAVISTGDLNRMGQRVNQYGWDFTDYRKNPIVLFGHDDYRPAIGKNVSLEVDGDNLRAVTEFAPTDFGRELFTLYSGGYMRAWSVGFKPDQITFTKDAQGNITEVIFDKMTLLEYSAVPLPANADAVNEAMSHGLITRATHDLLISTSKSRHVTQPADAPSLRDSLTGALAELATVRPICKAELIAHDLRMYRSL